MDDVLRLGGNTDELRMRVVAEFEKRRSPDEIAAFLPAVYQGGNGFTVDGVKGISRMASALPRASRRVTSAARSSKRGRTPQCA